MSSQPFYQTEFIRGRREAKYALASEVTARAIRSYIEPYMAVDPHARGLPGDRYSLVSLYLDNPALDLYHDTVRGEKNRHKLRIRRYVGKPEAPAFFEVKSRVDDIIIKRRAAVRPDAIEPLLAGERPRMSHLVKSSDAGFADLLFFRDLAASIDATPRMRVRYTREPLQGLDDPGVRVTFDRSLAGSPTPGFDIYGEDDTWHSASPCAVILEVKFNKIYPEWIARTLRRFDLVRTSIPKYVLCTDAVAGRGLHTAVTGRRVGE